MDNNHKEPLKKYQSIASHIKDMQGNLEFERDGQVVAGWSYRGILYLSRYVLSEEEAIALAHWILHMTAEQVENNE
jgi:hypothetical protein